MTAKAWLERRLVGAPEHLVAVMVAAVDSVEAADLPDRLAAGALRLYAEALAGGGGRADAFPLLAADALLTHAFEAQAELAPDGLADFAARWGGAGRLAEVVG